MPSLRRLRPYSFALATLAAAGCGSAAEPVTTPPGTQIDAYLEREGLVDEETTTASGLVYIVDAPGGEEVAELSDDITIHYKGYTPDGNVFDETDGTPRTFPLSRLIPAWQEGIRQIGRGGKIKLFAPPALAYGPSPPPGIPAGAVLIFDIELVDFGG